MTKTTKIILRATMLILAAALTLLLAGCSQPHQCPPSIPAAVAPGTIPVLLVVDDAGRPATASERDGGIGDPPLACETDANRNGIGDETEVETAEQALNGGDD